MSEEFRRVIFCMSSEGNLLNQWRDYGRDIVPYCIEFDGDYLWEDHKAEFRPSITQMIYDHTTQKVLLGEAFNRIFSVMEPLWDTFDEEKLERMATRASFQIGLILEQFKHPAFAAELEARLSVSHYTLSKTQLRPKFRSSSLGLVPYYEWKPRNKLKIRSVRVGPSPHSDASVEALKLFLEENKIDAKATVSAIPIRR